MNFNNDNSTQLNIGTATYTPSYSSKTAPNIILNDGTSGIYNPSINNIRIFTNNIDALTIDSNQCLYGNATGLTNLGYANIINKPTNFQSDWNSTVINKPTNFQSDWNSTVINKPSTFAADMTNIYTKTEVNNITTLTNYYNKTSTDTLLTGKESLLTFSAPLNRTSNAVSIDLGSYLTSATASTTYQPILTFSSPMLKTGSNVTIDLSTYDTITARNTALGSYLPLTGGTLTGTLNGTTITATTLSESGSTLINRYLSTSGQNTMYGKLQVLIPSGQAIPAIATTGGSGDYIILKQGSATVYPYSIGIDTNNLWHSVSSGSSHKFYVNGTSILDIASTTSTLTGTLNATTALQEGGTNLDAKYLRLSGATAMTGTLTGTTINATTLQEGGTALSSKYLKLDGTSTMTTNPLKLSSATVAAPALGTSGSTGDRIILYQGDSLNYPYSFGINSGTLWYSVPSTGVHNFYVNGTSVFTISSGGVVSTGPIGGTVINEGGVAISTKYLSLGGGTLTGALTGTTINATSFVEGGTALSSKYLSSASLSNYILKAGDTMTGALNITSTTTDNQLIITNTSTNRYASIKFYNGTQTGYIGIGCTVVGGTYQGNLFLETTNSIVFATGGYNTTSTPPRMILTSAGNLGIGVASPSVKLEVRGGTIQGEQLYVVDSASYGANQYGLLINAPTSTQGASIQTIQQSVGYNQNLMLQQTGSGYVYLGGSLTTGLRIAGWDTGNTLYQNTGNMGITVNTGNNITFNVGNGGEKMRVNSGGNVGIGTNNPNTRLHIEHASTSANASAGGLYVYNPNIGANNCSILGVRLKGGTTSYSGNRCGISMDIDGYYGWNIGINDNDRTDKKLRFNASWDNTGTDRMTLDYNGNFAVGGSMSGGALTSSGIANIHNGSPYAVPNNFMASGSLTIGGTTANYGGTTNWTSSTAGLMMECADNTEITIHDSGNRLASFMLYNGGATAQFNMGANKGWGTVKCNMVGGLKINNIDTPLTNANTQYLAGNPTTYTIYNKGYPFCLFYVTVGSNFGIYLGTNITAGSSFAPGLIYNGGITYYVPYFTNQVGNGTIMWIYNASGGVQVSCFEMWFN